MVKYREKGKDETLGILGQEVWVRDGYYDQGESSRRRRDRSRESECWQRGIKALRGMCLGNRVISIFDRGGDTYEVLAIMGEEGERYVIRGSQDRLLSDGKTHLFEAVRGCAPIGSIEVRVPPKSGQKGRTALLDIRARTVVIKPPKNVDRKGKELSIHVVEALEKHAPKGNKPLRWVLYTSESISTFEECVRVIELYVNRWKIEEFHKGLKTGCRIEERQFETRKTLETFLGLASVISVMLLNLRDTAKDETSQEHGLSEVQIALLRKRYPKIGKRPTAKAALRAIAQLGGFLGRKSDGNPGWQTLLRGMNELIIMEHGYFLAKSMPDLSSKSPELVGTA